MWWQISGVSPGLLTNVNNISSGLAKGQNWTLQCRASDNYAYSEYLNSSQVTINNSAPAISTENTVINASSGHSFTVFANVTDLDGASDIASTFINITSGSCVNTLNTSSGNIFGSKWNCTGTAFQATSFNINFTDLGGASAYSSISSNAYPNQLPAISSLVLNSSSGFNRSSDSLNAYFTTSDADSDATTNITDWRRNGTSIAVINMPFDTNVSSTAARAVRDYSIFGSNATLGGGDSGSAPEWTANGRTGGAYIFNGSTYINITPAFKINGSFTVEVWAKPATIDLGTIVSSRGPSEYGFDFKFFGFYTLHGDIGNGSAFITTTADANVIYSANNWYHIAYAVNQTGYSIYVNGSLVASGTYAPANPLLFDATHNFYLGQTGGNDEYFKGMIDEVKIYNRSLSTSQILADYQAGLAGHSIQIIVPAELAVGDNWTVAVTPNDRYQDGTTSISNQVLIRQATSTSCATGCLYVKGRTAGFNASIFDKSGNLDIYGSLFTTVGSPDGNDLLFKNGATTSAWIDEATGNLRINGTLTENQGTYCTPAANSFVINDTSGHCVAYISPGGNLWLRGNLNEHSII